jgi:dienelactone hydrolase
MKPFAAVRSLLLLALLFVAGHETFAATAPAEAPPGIARRILELTAADGRHVPALLTYPRAGMNVDMPAIVHSQGGPGATPLEGSGVWIAEGLAARGYTVIAPMNRHGDELFTFTFDQLSMDVRAAADFVAALGHRDILLAGSSFGSITTTRYVLDTGDTRIRAMLHFAPTADMSTFVRRAMGDAQYFAVVAEAGRLVSAGLGDRTVIAPEFQPAPPFPAGVKIAFTHSARTWLDLWGPSSSGMNTLLFPKVRMPMLLLLGEKDGFNDREMLERLKATATASPSVETRFYPGDTNHSFYPVQKQVIADVSAWLEAHGFGPRPRVVTDVVTINEGRMGTGMRRGIRYAPERGAEAKRPVVLFVHDWSDDALHGPSRALGPRLAQAGIESFAINVVRGPGELLRSRAAAGDAAIRDWVAYASRDGRRVVLAAHGFGALRAAHYLATATDARVAGWIALAPVDDAAAWLKAQVGPDGYATLVAAASRGGSEGAAPLVQFERVPRERGTQPVAMQPTAFLDTFGPSGLSLAAGGRAGLRIDEISDDAAVATRIAEWLHTTTTGR